MTLLPTPIPSKARPSFNQTIAIRGETGNAHTIAGQVYELEGRQFLRLDKPTLIVHPEHESLVVPPGDYEVASVRNYDRPVRTRTVLPRGD